MTNSVSDGKADDTNSTQDPHAKLASLQVAYDALRMRLASEEQRSQRTEDELRRVLSEGHALYLTSLDISSQLDISDILRSVLRRAVNMLKADTGLIYLVDKDTGELVIKLRGECHKWPLRDLLIDRGAQSESQVLNQP